MRDGEGLKALHAGPGGSLPGSLLISASKRSRLFDGMTPLPSPEGSHVSLASLRLSALN